MTIREIGCCGAYCKTCIEQQQASMGLVRFVDRYGNEKWGTPQQVRQWQQEEQDQERVNRGTLIREKETIIREIVRVRCQYCGQLYDEALAKCPNCGARR
jgi:rubrerythrin